MKITEPTIKETIRYYNIAQDMLLDAIVAECARAKSFKISKENWNRLKVHIEFYPGRYQTEVDYTLHSVHFNLIKEKLNNLKLNPSLPGCYPVTDRKENKL